MSQDLYHRRRHTEEHAIETAHKTRDILESCPETTMMWIDMDAKNLPKSHHVNREKMLTLLKQEVTAQSFPLVSAGPGSEAFSCGNSSAEGVYTHDDWLEEQKITGEYDAYLRGEI